jgi:hypothetical protein
MKLFRKEGKTNNNNENFLFWQQDNQPIQLITPKFTHQKPDNIHSNPVVACYVDKPEDYVEASIATINTSLISKVIRGIAKTTDDYKWKFL